MATMTPRQRDAFLQQPRIGKLVTLYADGAPTATPIWYDWDGETARIFTHVATPKVARIRHDPRVALVVEEPTGVTEAWVVIEGVAAIETQGGWELAQRLAPRYYPPDQAATALRDWQKSAADWVVIAITARRILSLAPA